MDLFFPAAKCRRGTSNKTNPNRVKYEGVAFATPFFVPMRFAALALFLTLAAPGLTAADPPKPVPKKTAVKKAPSKASTSRAATSKTLSARRATPASESGAPRSHAMPRVRSANRRRHLSAIRKSRRAPAAKGYLKGDANGVWDARSVDALQRYQADTKEDPTGHLTAASLIGLGLGPKTASLPGDLRLSLPMYPRDLLSRLFRRESFRRNSRENIVVNPAFRKQRCLRREVVPHRIGQRGADCRLPEHRLACRHVDHCVAPRLSFVDRATIFRNAR